MLSCPIQLHRQNLHMFSSRLIKKPYLLNTSNTSSSRLMTSWRSPMANTSNDMINIRSHTSFRWETRFGCICTKNTLLESIGSSNHSNMGPTRLTRLWKTNFELNIPPFIGLHPMFNVDCLRPYFPPLLYTLDIADQITSTELNQTRWDRPKLIISWTCILRTLANRRSNCIGL